MATKETSRRHGARVETPRSVSVAAASVNGNGEKEKHDKEEKGKEAKQSQAFNQKLIHNLTSKQLLVPVTVALVACSLGWFYAPDFVTARQVGDISFQVLGADMTLFVIPPMFSRFSMPITTVETRYGRIAWSVILGLAAYVNMRLRADGHLNDYSILLPVHAASYLCALPPLAPRSAQIPSVCCLLAYVVYAARYGVSHEELLCISVICSIWLASFSKHFLQYSVRLRLALRISCVGVGLLAPWIVPSIVCYCLPIEEIASAYNLVSDFVGSESLRKLSMDLLIITLNVQIPLGYLGIAFLRRQQARQNYMLEIGEGKVSAREYTKYVLNFILMIAVPYMLQRTAMESVNTYASGCFTRDLENVLRIETVLPASTQSGVLLAAVGESNHTLSSFVDSFNGVVSTSYDIIERKVFSLPKLALLPGMLWSKPWLVISVLPVSILLDAGKSLLVGMLSSRIEDYSQEIQKIADLRQRIEQHDTKHEELIRRGSVGKLTKDRWYEISNQLGDLTLRSGALQSVRSFVQWLYWQDFMKPGFECALGFLLEVGHITNVDIYLYIRVVEDSIDMLLTRSRLQAQLARMETQMQRVSKLKSGLSDVRARKSAHCEVRSSKMSLTNVSFSRGNALQVHIPQLTFPPGVYAVTGANGCGKSTFFGILASCSGTALPACTELDANSQIVLPSDDIVEITQQVYCPIQIKPIAWLLRSLDIKKLSLEKMSHYESEVTKFLKDLQFGGNIASNGSTIDLHAEKEDWYGELSGGQRLKVELIAKIFLRESCPAIVLLDEAFAPLDPDSKLSVQRKLKSFCSRSTILVIYHSDVNAGCVGGDRDGFFDGNLRFESGTARLVKTCERQGTETRNETSPLE